MGLTLTKTAEWTSAQGGAGGKLELTPINQQILETISNYITGYTAKNPDQGNLVFKQPLTWVTSLKPSKLTSGFIERDGESLSTKTDPAGNPLAVLRKHSDFDYEISVRSIEMLVSILNATAEKKLTEVRACLEYNRDPVAKILGDRFSTVYGEDGSFYRYMEEILKSDTADDASGSVDKKIVLKMALEFHNLDVRMMSETLSKITEEIRVTPQSVENEVALIKEFVGKDEHDSGLLHVKPVPLYKFVHQNGCRAPPWRQLHGDIAYFLVRCEDTDELSLTASTTGWFENEGVIAESGDLNFNKQSTATHRDLMTLLVGKSPKFATFMSRADFPSSAEKIQSTNHTQYQHRGSEDEVSASSSQHGGDNNHNRNTRKSHAAVKSKDAGRQNSTKKPAQPSMRWRYLHEAKDKPMMAQEESDDLKSSARRNKWKKKQHSATGGQKPLSESESSSESDDEEETQDHHAESNADQPSEYWQISKFVKYLKGGNQTSTIIALCALRDFPLHQEVCQKAIRDVGGLEVLINLLETEEVRCKIGALKILKEISNNAQIRQAIVDIGGLPTMVELLKDRNRDLKCLSAETIANVAKFRRARRTVRMNGGIRKLVALLDCPNLSGPSTPDTELDIEMARCGALALWSCSKSTKNKLAMKRAGAIPLLARLLKSSYENMLIPVIGTLQECASEESYRIAIRTEGMIEDLVKNLKSKNPELQKHCAFCIFKCAEENETRDLIRQFHGLDPLSALLGQQDNKHLLAAVTGAIWKCAVSEANVQKFKEMGVIEKLVGLLNDQPEEVLINAVGALGEMAQDPGNRALIRKAGGISPLVNLLTGTNQPLLINTTKAVGRCAEDTESMGIIDRMDGVRLLWSLLKNPRPEVQKSAAWAICPCIQNAKDAGEMVRSFVGGLELIVSLLKSEFIEVLAAVCAAVANIARDEENLAVITDHGVVPMLAHLTPTTDDVLRCHLAEAIARCCTWGKNREEFGKEGAVAPLVKYLKSKDKRVHRTTAQALFQLSKNPSNCITMHEHGVVQLLLGLVGSEDEDLQLAAAGAIANIRRLALANEKSSMSAKQAHKDGSSPPVKAR